MDRNKILIIAVALLNFATWLTSIIAMSKMCKIITISQGNEETFKANGASFAAVVPFLFSTFIFVILGYVIYKNGMFDEIKAKLKK